MCILYLQIASKLTIFLVHYDFAAKDLPSQIKNNP